MSQKVNIIERLVFELADNDIALWNLSHYVSSTPLVNIYKVKKYITKYKKIHTNFYIYIYI